MSSIILSGSINGGKKCNICLKIYKASYIQTHLVYTHGKGKQNKCDVCTKVFATKFRLNEHKNSIHVENSKKKICSKCPKEFNSLVNYSQHYGICHKNSEVVSCNICNKEFTGSPKLKEHLRKNHLKLDCNKCSLKYTTKASLNRHMKTCNIDLNISVNDVDDPLFDQSLDNVSWEIEGSESE